MMADIKLNVVVLVRVLVLITFNPDDYCPDAVSLLLNSQMEMGEEVVES